ncbi:MAG TPA: UvrD-helicase domain-containing protein [Thermoanaerobaculia bacterium]|nr:UvrD-helicase domain-containing protein [Thermoanaerobaculia bacterium]
MDRTPARVYRCRVLLLHAVTFYADLHIHSKYSRATSRDADLEHLALWARRKGITVVGTGDFTHPAWFEEIRSKLIPAEPGLFRLRPEIEREVEQRLPASCHGPTRFLLEVEISTIYKKGDRTRKVHHLLYAANLETAGRIRERLGAIGNISADGRPILGLDSRHLLEITLESGPDAYLIPAHIWTPWFAALGSKSGFDSIEECYGDLAPHIFAVETGLSSDPPMNWRVSHLDRFTLISNSDAHSPPMLGREACAFNTDLDYFAIRRALETGEGYQGTVEFFPEEGKYHLDGHRACGVRLEPDETRRNQGLCPACGKPLTVGVMHRVEELADRLEEVRTSRMDPFRCLVPLPEVLAEIHGVGPKSRTVENSVSQLVGRLGPEIDILERVPLEEIEQAGGSLLLEALTRLRAGNVRRDAGYDGEYGVIRLFEPDEIRGRAVVAPLFKTLTSVPSPALPPSLPGREAPPPASLFSSSSPLSRGGGEEGRERGARGVRALDPEQQAATEIVDGPLLILAGPGTGKTRTLTHRLAHLITERGVSPGQCLAVTFSRRAAAEMEERLASLLPGMDRPLVATFHGLGLTLLREQAAEIGLQGFRVATPAERTEIARELFDLSASRADRCLEDIGRVRRGWASHSPDEGPRLLEIEKRVTLYEEALTKRSLFDFDDLLLRPLALLGRRADLAEHYRRRFRWISIDEYQDIDALQYALVRLLAPPGSNLCAIGDPDQSIYGFRGADVSFFLRFQEDYPGAHVIHLTRNYRSTRTLVEAACQAIRPASLVPDRRLTAVREGVAERIVIQEAASERAEAEMVVHTLEKLLGGTSSFSFDSGRVDAGDAPVLSCNDVAILYRTEAQTAPLIEALGRSGIPFQKRSHRPLTEQPGVRILLPILQQLGREDISRSVESLLESAIREASGAAEASDRTAVLAAAELLRPIALRSGDLDSFLAEVALGGEVDTWDPRAERVSLLTLHASKGLEFPVVFLVGCDDGLLPLTWPGSGETDVAEERRLFFVGITRACSRLFLFHSRKRTLRGQTVETRPSPFLADVEEVLLERRQAPVLGPRRPEQLLLL